MKSNKKGISWEDIKNKPEGAEGTTIQNCEFNAVKVDGETLTVINNITQALRETARGLANLTTLFEVLDVSVDSMIKLDSVKGITIANSTIRGKKYGNKLNNIISSK